VQAPGRRGGEEKRCGGRVGDLREAVERCAGVLGPGKTRTPRTSALARSGHGGHGGGVGRGGGVCGGMPVECGPGKE
jgi:hypothetical protein